MKHVFVFLKQVSRKPDRIVAPGSLEPFRERGQNEEPQPAEEIPMSSRVAVLALVELLLPAAGLVLGLRLGNGSWWWLLVGAGTLLSVLVGYVFRSEIQLYPLDLSRQ